MGWSYHNKPPLGWPLDYDSGLADFVGCWLMNGGSGNKVYDLSGNGNVGTFGGDTSWSSGKFGSCPYFPGVTDYITASTPSQILNASALTYSTWIKTDAAAGAQSILRLEDTFLLVDSGNDLIYWYSDVDIASETASSAFDVGIWYHIVVTQTGTDYAIYKNGVLVGSGSTSALDLVQAGQDIVIGAYNTSGLWDFEGQIDYVSLYNRALTAQEIQQLYRNPFCMFMSPDDMAVLAAATVSEEGNAGIMTCNTGFWGATY